MPGWMVFLGLLGGMLGLLWPLHRAAIRRISFPWLVKKTYEEQDR